MRTLRVRTAVLAMAACGAAILTASPGWTAPACPLSYNATDAAKSHKLFLYFPAVDDASFKPFETGVSPARHFDVAELDPNIGTAADLEARIHDIVVDDYCEFNVQVLNTTTNPEQLMPPPPLRHTVAVGSDEDPTNNQRWGQAPFLFPGDSPLDVDFARVWGGTYVKCEGGNGKPGQCSAEGALTGSSSSLEHWAQAIGGTAAHEAGHTYGLAHTDDGPVTGLCMDLGSGPRPNEDALTRHLMPNGCYLDGLSRTTYRRHFSDRTFGILAKNVGLSIQTMHNWDLVNPNSGTAHSLSMDFLSPKTKLTFDWIWIGPTSPWVNPKVTQLSGTAMFQGKTFNKWRITWSQKNPGFAGTPGVVSPAGQFHVGVTFTGVDFNQPDPIVIQNITLFDINGKALPLHPRLPMYDAGTVDAADGSFAMHFYPQLIDSTLQLQSAVIYQLPRVASIESMVGAGQPFTFDGLPISSWTATRCVPTPEGNVVRCALGNLGDPPHVSVVRNLGDPDVIDCSQGRPAGVRRQDSPNAPDYEGAVCAGTTERDPFPSTTVYAIATFVDPAAEHWDPKARKIVVGPVTSKVFYQFAGVRDLERLVK
jgi:hypothetical protein